MSIFKRRADFGKSVILENQRIRARKRDGMVLRRLIKHIRKEAGHCRSKLGTDKERHGDRDAMQWRIEEVGLLRRLQRLIDAK